MTPVLAAHGVGLVELQFRRERPGWVLRVMIEHPTGVEPGLGITLDRCADVSRDLSVKLDATDLIVPAYTLEVSSPGIERPLYEAADYERFAGQPAKVVLGQPIEAGPLRGQGSVQGVIRGVSEGAPVVAVSTRSGVHEERVALGAIKHAHLVYDPAAAQSRGRGKAKGAKAGGPLVRGGSKSSE